MVNMKTTIKVNKNYQIIERKTDNKKELPINLIDLIIPIMQNEAPSQKKKGGLTQAKRQGEGKEV
jgi:hypothetical protein